MITRSQNTQNFVALDNNTSSRPNFSFEEVDAYCNGTFLESLFPKTTSSFQPKEEVVAYNIGACLEQLQKAQLQMPQNEVSNSSLETFELYKEPFCLSSIKNYPMFCVVQGKIFKQFYLVSFQSEEYIPQNENLKNISLLLALNYLMDFTECSNICVTGLENNLNVSKEKFLECSTNNVSWRPLHLKDWEDLYKQTVDQMIWFKKFQMILKNEPKLVPRAMCPYVDKANAGKEYLQFAAEAGFISMIPFVNRSSMKKLNEQDIYTIYDLPDTHPLYQKNKNMIEANRNNIDLLVSPEIKNDEIFQICMETTKNNVHFIDFEWNMDQNIYLIGVVHHGAYKPFFVKINNQSKEPNYLGLWKSFSDYLEEHKDDSFVFYKAEKNFFKSWCKRLNVNCPSLENWKDYFPLVRKHIGILLCFNFKLKSVQQVLHKKGIMEENFSDDCGDGLESMKLYKDYLEMQSSNHTREEALACKKTLEHYNFIDCSTLDHLDSYFRTIF